MRKLTAVMIAVWSLVALLITALLIGGIFSQKTGRYNGLLPDNMISLTKSAPSGSMELLADRTSDIRGIDEIRITFSADKVVILEAPDDQVRLIHRAMGIGKDRAATLERDGDSLVISRPSQSGGINFGTVRWKSEVDIYLPSSYHGDLVLKLSSGSLTLDADLSLEDFDATLSSGNMQLRSRVTAEDAYIKVSSGNFTMTELSTDEFDITLSSGNMRVDSLSGSGYAQVSSGSLHLSRVEIKEALSVKVSSGSANVGLGGDPSLSYTGTKSSGNLSTYFPTNSADNGKNSSASVGSGPYYKELEAHVSSGSLRITQA